MFITIGLVLSSSNTGLLIGAAELEHRWPSRSPWAIFVVSLKRYQFVDSRCFEVVNDNYFAEHRRCC